MNARAPLRTLVIGCGNIAGGFDAGRSPDTLPYSHAGALTRSAGFDLAACVEPDTARREAFMAHWHVAAGYASMSEIGADERFDVISVCSPTALHSEHIANALHLKPRLLFCEKPVAPSLEDAEALVSRCEESGVLLAINYTRRWAPDVVRLRDEIAAGQWGAVRSVCGTYNKGILNNGGHLIDLLHFLFGTELELISAGAPTWDFWKDDPTVPAMLTMKDGTPVHLVTANAGDYALFEMQIITSFGVVTMTDGGTGWQLRKVVDSPHFKGYRSLDPIEQRAGEYAFAMTNAFANIEAALTYGTALASTGRSALEAQRLCEKIKISAIAGRERISA